MEARRAHLGDPSDLECIKKRSWFSIAAFDRFFFDFDSVLAPKWDAKVDHGVSFLDMFLSTEKGCQTEVMGSPGSPGDSSRGPVGP